MTQREQFKDILKEFKAETAVMEPRDFLKKISDYMKTVDTEKKLEMVFDLFSETEQKAILSNTLMSIVSAYADKFQSKQEKSRIITL